MARKPRRTRGAVTRREFDALAATVRQCCRDLEVQFTRTAQVQAELDHVKQQRPAPRRASRTR
jgi:hypothetical protein